MENTNKAKGYVEAPKVKGVFTFAEHSIAFFDVIKEANPRLRDELKPKTVALFQLYDALNALPAKADSVMVDGIAYQIKDYMIPEILAEYIPPKFITITGRSTAVDLVLRNRDARVTMTPDEANAIVVGLCKYLRIPVTQFTRPDGISFCNIPEEKLGLGNFYNAEEFGYADIRYLIDHHAVVPSKVWNEMYIESNLIVKMGKHLINRFTTQLMKGNSGQGSSSSHQSRAQLEYAAAKGKQETQPGNGE